LPQVENHFRYVKLALNTRLADGCQ